MKRIINSIMQKMQEIEYGWVDKDGIIHTKTKRDFFLTNYRLQSLDQTLTFKVGTCWEQTELIRYYFAKEGIDISSYIVIYNDDSKIARHTIAVVYDGAKYHWVENAWEYLGRNIEFDSVEDILDSLISIFPMIYKINDFDPDKIEIYKYDKPEDGLSFYEFSDYCRSQERIRLDEYYYKKIKEFYINAPLGLYTNEIIEYDDYKLEYSNYLKEPNYNYVFDVLSNDSFKTIEKDVIEKTRRIDVDPCFMIFPENAIYKMNVFNILDYKKEDVSWKTFDKIYLAETLKSNCEEKIVFERTVDTNLFAKKMIEFYAVDADYGYINLFNEYKGLINSIEYNADLYFIKLNHEIIGVVTCISNQDILEVKNLVLKEEFRNKKIGKESLIKTIKIAQRKEKRVVFISIEKDNFFSECADRLGFKEIAMIKKYFKNN